MTIEHSLTLQLADETQTVAFGRQLAALISAPLTIYLTGELGAGKTTFSRGLIQAWVIKVRLRVRPIHSWNLMSLKESKYIISTFIDSATLKNWSLWGSGITSTSAAFALLNGRNREWGACPLPIYICISSMLILVAKSLCKPVPTRVRCY